jgi:hypothetical protein
MIDVIQYIKYEPLIIIFLIIFIISVPLYYIVKTIILSKNKSLTRGQTVILKVFDFPIKVEIINIDNGKIYIKGNNDCYFTIIDDKNYESNFIMIVDYGFLKKNIVEYKLKVNK